MMKAADLFNFFLAGDVTQRWLLRASFTSYLKK